MDRAPWMVRSVELEAGEAVEGVAEAVPLLGSVGVDNSYNLLQLYRLYSNNLLDHIQLRGILPVLSSTYSSLQLLNNLGFQSVLKQKKYVKMFLFFFNPRDLFQGS